MGGSAGEGEFTEPEDREKFGPAPCLGHTIGALRIRIGFLLKGSIRITIRGIMGV